MIKPNKFFLLLVSIVLFTSVIRANAGNKPVLPTVIKYSTSGSINDINAFTDVKPVEKEFSAEKKDLLRRLDEARTLNNIQLKEQLEERLNKLDGRVPVPLKLNLNVTSEAPTNGKIPFNNDPDYMSTMITGGGILSSATQTETSEMPHPGRIWTAATIYNAGSDTCKIYHSDDGGQTWTYSQLFFFSGGIHYNPGELDIELVYDGNVLWVFGTAGFYDPTENASLCTLFRYNSVTNSFLTYILLWPTTNIANCKYYNPRITSDNTNYFASSHVYLSCSFDSLYSGGHYLRQKYAHISNPFNAVPSIDYSEPNSLNNGGFYWSKNSALPGTYVWSDIAYFRTSSNNNRIITVFTFTTPADCNQYMAWSDDFGATITGYSTITENSFCKGSKMVFNGGASQCGMITLVRQFSGNDWDPYYISTTNGGANWTSGYIDESPGRTRSVDIIAPRGANNLFKVAYTQDSAAGIFGYYTGGNSTSWNSPASHTVTPFNADTTFMKAIAGYTNSGGDDCLALYSLNGGVALFASRLCETTIGIQNTNNSVPKSYSLAQNYPNPFNPSTTINFSIPKSGIVKLVVYDIAGKVVSVLVNEQLNTGSYQYDFNASNISSGVYFYRLETDGFSDVKKMLLVK